MAAISDQDKVFINANSLTATLNPLRPSFKPRDEETSSTSSDETLDLSVTRDAIANLLAMLLIHPVAKRIKSALTGRPLDRELATLYAKARSDDFVLLPFKALTTAVANNASDLKIWKAVLQLVDSLARITPPSSRSIAPSFSGTPYVRSSASHQGTNQTRRDLEQPLRAELAGCTFQNVTGFNEKYFGKETRWYNQASKVYASVYAAQEGNLLKEFPGMHSENKIWAWLDKLQTNHLPHSPGKYFRTTGKGQTTTEAERQLDLFIKPRNAPETNIHPMRDVLVVGELTSSPKSQRWLAKFIQLATYIRDVFAAQPTRRFVPAFLLFDTQMELWVFDRSGAYSSDTFNITSDGECSERFIRVITGYTLMTEEELGLDTFLRRDGQSITITIADAGGDRDRTLQLQLLPFMRQRSIVSRGTTCYRTTDGKQVVKCSWRTTGRRAESEYLQAARGVQGVATLEGSREIISIKKLRSGLQFSASMERKIPLNLAGSASRLFSSHSSQLQSLDLGGTKRGSDEGGEPPAKKTRTSSLRDEVAPNNVVALQASFAPPADLFRDRTLTCLAISPAGRPLQEFQSVEEFLAGMRDAIRAHQALFIERQILHRDISEHNIILTDPKKNAGFSGMLIDLELAVTVGADGKNKQTGARYMTGTLEFMALEVLEGIDNTYRHDLESFFYVFLIVCIRYGWKDGKSPAINPLSAWYTGNNIKDIYSTKSGHMGLAFEKIVLGEFSPAFLRLTGLARELREILFSKGALFTGTPEDSKDIYKPMIAAFNKALKELSCRPQQSHDTTSSTTRDDNREVPPALKRKANGENAPDPKRPKQC